VLVLPDRAGSSPLAVAACPFCLLLLIPVGLASLSGVPAAIQQPARRPGARGIWGRLSDLNLRKRAPPGDHRLSQWGVRQLVAERPWLGWGAAASA